MSASDTKLEKQKARHRAPLIVLGLCVAAAALALVFYVSYGFNEGQDPAGAERQIEVAPGGGQIDAAGD